ncbi:hypothetical protein, conserved [Eimeria necatrix]|uniref:Uncharacterized protein n=1 Tax=Eimeria necatrix TaxID=51315 RepID=U6MPN8_9EIME|nr:hypothetical protein, conserved [Eimeria necatrix]CDJ64459.1 hypothetical protein, conserved [Eimeria necatrix]
MRDIQDVDGNAQLLEDGKAVSESAAPSSTLVAKEAGARRRHMRKAQRLLVFNVGLGILLGLCAASFCIKPGFGYPWMPHRLQRVLLLLFAWELLLFFVAPPVCLLWRLASATGSDQRSDKQRDSVCVLLLAVCEFGCGVCASAMSAFSIYTGKILLAQDATNGFITLLSFGMGACLPFSLFGNPKFRNAKKINSRAARLEAELCVTGAILNMILALSAALALAQSSLPGKKLSVLGAAEYPVMFVGALLLVKSLAHFTRELLHHRKAASGASMHPEH